MPLCGGPQASKTALEKYAETLASEDLDGSQSKSSASECYFPMYTLPSEKLLEMSELKPHEELLSEGSLEIFNKKLGRAAFVSHQWVGGSHPDPEFKQMQVLKDTLRHLMSGESEVSVDLLSEAVYFRSKGISAEEWRAKRLFLWYDYFSCPQLEQKPTGPISSGNLTRAIDSIPVYVSRCDFFMALCPVLSNPEGSQVFSDYSWQNRGWCRVEQVVRELTVHGGGSWIVVKSAKHQELKVCPLANSSPGEGTFTVESDRARVAGVLHRFVERKLLACLEMGDLPQYRMLLNKQSAFFRNLPVEPVHDMVPGFEQDEPTPLNNFLYQNGFKTPLEIDSAGWSPLCYASMNGDPMLIQSLLQERADPNTKTKKGRPEVNMDKHSPVLSICARFKNHEAMKLLIAARAAVNSQAVHTPLGVACLNNDPVGVRLLCEAKADPYARNPFGDHSLNMAAAAGSLEVIDVLLQDYKNLDLSLTLHTAVILQGGSSSVVTRLLNARADIDGRYGVSSAIIAMVHRVKGLQYRYGKSTMFRRMCYHSKGATPLMLAMICGNYEAAAALLHEGASPHQKNARGVSSAAIVGELGGIPDFLQEALSGQMSKCSSIAIPTPCLESQKLWPVRVGVRKFCTRCVHVAFVFAPAGEPESSFPGAVDTDWVFWRVFCIFLFGSRLAQCNLDKHVGRIVSASKLVGLERVPPTPIGNGEAMRRSASMI